MSITLAPANVDVLSILEGMHRVQGGGVVTVTFVTESGSSYAVRKDNVKTEFISESRTIGTAWGRVEACAMVEGRLVLCFTKGSTGGDRITTSRVMRVEWMSEVFGL